MNKPADPATPFAEVYQSFLDDLEGPGRNDDRQTDQDRLDRQAQAPGHPRAIVWLRFGAWDS